MKSERWYGLIGLLSLLGFVGVFTPERYFLGFFAFAVDFQYFFSRPDEMQEGQIARSAALGFFSGMGVTALAVLAREPLLFLFIFHNRVIAKNRFVRFHWRASIILRYSRSIRCISSPSTSSPSGAMA